MDIQEYEIMAPVGSRESLAAAIQAGAGSIYFGIGQLNMRSHSANHFTIEDLKEIVKRDDKRAKGKKLESEIGYFGVGQRKEVPYKGRSRCDNRTEEGIEMLWLQAQENNGNGV